MNILMAVCQQKALIAKIEDIAVPIIIRSLKPEGQDSVDSCLELGSILLADGEGSVSEK